MQRESMAIRRDRAFRMLMLSIKLQRPDREIVRNARALARIGIDYVDLTINARYSYEEFSMPGKNWRQYEGED